MNLEELYVTKSSTVREALEAIDRTGARILLLIDDQQRLVRTVTDGDIRRLILAGVKPQETLLRLSVARPVTGTQGIDAAAALRLMNEHSIEHLPIVDEAGKVIRLFRRQDLDEQIFLSPPHLGSSEMEYVELAFRSNWIAPLGPNVDAFEREVAKYAGVGHAAALSSGTAAIHLGLQLLDVGSGDTVICSTLTFVASANPILYLGARPVFIDSEPESWNMSPQALARALEDADRRGALPKAIVVVNLYGQSADYDKLVPLAKRYGIPILEDAAESMGATYKNHASGSLGDVSVFSFNGNKIITTSGGGMLLSDDGEIIKKARFLATQARDPAAHYQHSHVGYNYRMSNVLAGIGRGQMRVLEERVRSRRRIFEMYRESLADIPAIRWMPEAPWGKATRWLSTFTIDPRLSDVTPSKVWETLAAQNVEARPIWKPMHLQPLFSNSLYYSHESETDISSGIFRQGVCLPSGSSMTDGSLRRVAGLVRRAFAQ
jgi:dTDP-4-amino-4,6-dideoxygalactose transaminase